MLHIKLSCQAAFHCSNNDVMWSHSDFGYFVGFLGQKPLLKQEEGYDRCLPIDMVQII